MRACSGGAGGQACARSVVGGLPRVALKRESGRTLRGGGSRCWAPPSFGGHAAHRPQCPVHPAGRCSAAVLRATACRTGEGAAAERGTVALATRASGLPEGRAPAGSRDPSSSAPKKGRAGGKSDWDTSVTTSVSRHDNVPLVSSTVDIMKKQPCLRICSTALRLILCYLWYETLGIET